MLRLARPRETPQALKRRVGSPSAPQKVTAWNENHHLRLIGPNIKINPSLVLGARINKSIENEYKPELVGDIHIKISSTSSG